MPTILGGRYRLDTLIGGGGMGEVWKAHDELLDRDVAVKVIRAHLADDLTIRERLRTEAHLAGSLHHQSIVDVYDYGEHHEESGEEGGRTTPFLVMPLVDGVSLSAMLKSRVALPVGETMAIVVEMANALAAAHAAGIVHRDLKPANVMLTRSGRVMILDFGIARSTDGAPLTQTGALLGTADYLSPEQAGGKQATYASDLYALGVVAFTCLTGTPPFHRETDIATALAHVQAPIPALPEEILSSGIGPLIEGLLAKEPAQRPSLDQVAATAGELATHVPTQLASATDPDATQPGTGPLAMATVGAAAGEPTGDMPTVGVSPVAAPTQTNLAPVSSGEPVADDVPRERRGQRRTVLVSSALLALAAIVLALMYVVRPGQIEVPDVRKMTSVEAASTLTKAGFKVETHEVDAADFEAGTIATQSPEAGSKAGEGSVVDLGVATGLVAIPDDLVGKSYKDAAKALEELGLKPERRNRASDKTAGTVTAVDPSKRAKPGDTVVLTVAIGGSNSDDDSGGDNGNGNGSGGTPTPTPTPTATTTTAPTEPPPTTSPPPTDGG